MRSEMIPDFERLPRQAGRDRPGDAQTVIGHGASRLRVRLRTRGPPCHLPQGERLLEVPAEHGSAVLLSRSMRILPRLSNS
jgi:hypothetical protein